MQRPFSFKVEVDSTSTVTGVSVFHEGQRSPFQTLSSCNIDLPMQLLEGDEQLALVNHADFNFDGNEDLQLLQYVNDHLGKSLFCVYLWDDKTDHFRYEPQLFIADPIPHPETRTITSHNDYQGGPFTDSTTNGAVLSLCCLPNLARLTAATTHSAYSQISVESWSTGKCEQL